MKNWQTLVIVGCQWGDEGKGKFVDYFAKKADYIVRFQGGNNAGHTVVYQGQQYKLNLIPSGILYPSKKLVLASGAIIDPKILVGELKKLNSKGIKPNLLISNRANVIMPWHIALDPIFENLKGKFAAGSTKRGIAPCYSDKYLRCGIRMIDFVQLPIFRKKLDLIYQIKKTTLKPKIANLLPKKNKIWQEYSVYAKKLKFRVTDTEFELNWALSKKKKIIFETAMAVMLDIDHGVYPHTTSANTIAGAVCTGAGIPPQRIDYVLGVVKAYLSRVGVSPLPTEITDSTADYIREQGIEYGTTTGRPRRIGWLDLTSIRLAKMLNQLNALALTKPDVLGGLKTIKICTHYLYKKKKLFFPPAQSEQFSQCQPVYKIFPGWPKLSSSEWQKIVKLGYHALPKNLKNYLNFIQQTVEIPIKFISLGADRKTTIAL